MSNFKTISVSARVFKLLTEKKQEWEKIIGRTISWDEWELLLVKMWD